MNLVTPSLAVGSRLDANDSQLLQDNNIRAMLSLAPAPRPQNIWCQLHLQMADRKPIPAVILDQAMAFMDTQIKLGRVVMVHCEMGISRSPTLVASYLHQFHGLTLEQAFDRVKAARPIAEPHIELVRSLYQYHQQRVQQENAA